MTSIQYFLAVCSIVVHWRVWNSLRRAMFECVLEEYVRYDPQNNTKPIYYYIGTRLGQILHARLRMQCSSLNHHLFRKNIVNSPFCQCGATETTAHFLLHCPRHNATRLRYIHTINLPINLNTDLLLFGSTDLTNTLNTDIFLNVQKFIISSKRFTWFN
jgi:hypothetical protein